MAVSALLATLLCTLVLPVLLFLVAVKLWEVYTVRGGDARCARPLPPGSMGMPFIGETLQLILQVTVNAPRTSSPVVSSSFPWFLQWWRKPRGEIFSFFCVKLSLHVFFYAV